MLAVLPWFFMPPARRQALILPKVMSEHIGDVIRPGLNFDHGDVRIINGKYNSARGILIMRSTILVVLALAGVLSAEAQAADQSAAEQQIRQTDQEWVSTVANKHPNAIAEFYTKDGALLAPGAPIAQGREAIANAWKAFVELKDFHITFAPSKIEVASSGDMAYEIGTYSLGFQGDKGKVEDKGKYVVVWKNTGGHWKAAADIFNSNGNH